MNIGYDTYNCIIGTLYVVVSDKGVERLFILKKDFDDYIKLNPIKQDCKICENAINQLDEYFNKKRKYFDIPLNINTTEFRKSVYNELLKIPYGETRSYSDVAKAINNEKAVRAVGQANRANNIPIIIPCHRVLGKNGSAVGYLGDKIDIKDALLHLEKDN